MKRIINSILDNDLYKLTMQNAVIKLFPNKIVRYEFIDRNKLSYPENFAEKLREQVELMASLKLTKGEKKFLLEKAEFLPPTYVDFLAGYQYDPNEVKIFFDRENRLHITIEGYWYRTILWEVTLMSLISELYFIETGQDVDLSMFNAQDIGKCDLLASHNAYYADFGTRRRYSFANQDRIVGLFKENGGHNFVGTSNVYLAYKHGVRMIGTHAHEWFMVHAALYGYKMANHMALENWVNVYNGDLGIALSDTYTTEVFFRSFNKKFAKLFDGVRHDSGDPFKFTDKVIAHYKSMGIDPMSKVIVFSDGLNTELAAELKEYCVGKIKCSFGIGTHFTNDLGIKALNIVIKITAVFINGEWVDAVKLSDNVGKNTGAPEEVGLCKRVFKIAA